MRQPLIPSHASHAAHGVTNFHDQLDAAASLPPSEEESNLLRHVSTCALGCGWIHDSVSLACAEGLRLAGFGVDRSAAAGALERCTQEPTEYESVPFTSSVPPMADWRKA